MKNVEYVNESYVIKADGQDAMLPKKWGFKYLENSTWVTRNPLVARSAIAYAKDKKTVNQLMKDWRRYERYIQNSRAKEAEFNTPVPETKSLFPHQRAGVAQMWDILSNSNDRNRGVLLADDMGLGKTAQAISIINRLESRDPKILITAPAAVKINWKQELSQWLTKAYTYSIASGDYLPAGANITIINYDILHKFSRQLSQGAYDLIIADEAHYIKNNSAKRSKAFYNLKANYRVLMTGTPIVNGHTDVFYMYRWLQPDICSSKTWFKERFCNDLVGLHDMLRGTVMIRRLKREVLSLPPKNRQVITLPAEGCSDVIDSERDAYNKNRAEIDRLTKAVIGAAKANNTVEYKKAIEALRYERRRVLEHISKERENVAKAKLPLSLKHIENCVLQSGKVVVFAHHRSILKAIKAKFGDIAVCLWGGMSETDKDNSVSRFQNDPDIKLFVGSLTAAGVGITLTAASHVVFVELDWVPHTLSQAEDRCYRIGQDESVLVQHLVLDGSLDAPMSRKLINKQEIIDRGLDG